jgi:hypothetical protein
VTATTGIVVVQGMNLVKPKQPTKIGKLGVDRSTHGGLEPLMEQFLNPSCELGLGQHGRQAPVQTLIDV